MFVPFYTTSVRSFCFHFSCALFETPMTILKRGKPVHKSCISMDDFLFRTPKQRAHKTSELFSEKKISWQKKSNQLPGKKKKRTSPIKQKILHLRLPIKKKKTTKRFHKWKESYKIDQKWLTKVGYILYCKRCSKFPKLHYRKHELRRK